jgi:hypothetical protein
MVEIRYNSPCADQSQEEIEKWLRANVALGTEVVVRHTQSDLLRYQRGRVVRLGRGRFEVATQQAGGTYSESGNTFYYSGRNCWHPKGQTSLVIPTPAVLEACDRCGPYGTLPPPEGVDRMLFHWFAPTFYQVKKF